MDGPRMRATGGTVLACVIGRERETRQPEDVSIWRDANTAVWYFFETMCENNAEYESTDGWIIYVQGVVLLYETNVRYINIKIHTYIRLVQNIEY